MLSSNHFLCSWDTVENSHNAHLPSATLVAPSLGARLTGSFSHSRAGAWAGKMGTAGDWGSLHHAIAYLSPAQIPEPPSQKMQSNDSCFPALHFRVVCSTAVDNCGTGGRGGTHFWTQRWLGKLELALAGRRSNEPELWGAARGVISRRCQGSRDGGGADWHTGQSMLRPGSRIHSSLHAGPRPGGGVSPL